MIKILERKELMKAESILFNVLKNNVAVVRSPGFNKWFHDTYPNIVGINETDGKKEQHHILGSLGSLKGTDLLSMPVSRSEHQEAEKHKSEFCIENLAQAINILQRYVVFLESIGASSSS